jgi:outer membrane protein assembly factor BamB
MAKFKKRLLDSGESGRISVVLLSSAKHLPYPDNFLNVLVLSKKSGVPQEEALRVLVPGGKVLGSNVGTLVKKYPPELDAWPQWQHGSDNVVVSNDRRVGPPRHLQWLESPPWGRMHNDMEIPAPVSFVLTENGRMFYDIDEGRPETVDLPCRFSLYARDAFNGMLLWKRPLKNWYKDEEYRRGNPPVVIQSRLICHGDFLFLTESDAGPVLKLNAATGKTIHTYPGTENAMELAAAGDALYVVLWKRLPPKEIGYNQRRGYASTFYLLDTPKDKLSGKKLKPLSVECVEMSIMKIDIPSGRVLWEKKGGDYSPVFPQSLAVSDGEVYFKTPEYLVRLDEKSGNVVWKTPIGIPLKDYLSIAMKRNVWSSPWSSYFHMFHPNPWYMNSQFIGKCIVYKDLVLTTTHDQLYAVSRKDGKVLWQCKSWQGFFLPPDIIPIGDKVYVGSALGQGGFFPVDIKTGKMEREIKIHRGGMIHHRCYRRIGTVKYLLSSKAGIELHDIKSGTTSLNQWTRGSCLAGFIPGNGLIYMTPHPCACFTKVKMNGMLAYAPETDGQSDLGVPVKVQLEKGSAYGMAGSREKARPSDWFAYRHDMDRSGSTPAVVGAKLREKWKVSIGGELASLAAADGSLYASAKNKHILYCLDIATGKTKWKFLAGGRIDSAPTVKYGFVVFGSADGWVYCLSAANGKLVWRYHPAPFERYVGAFEQLESAWPIHGAVIVLSNEKNNGGKPVVYVNAGRNSFLDSGIYLCALDLKTGGLLAKTTLHGPYDKDGNPISEMQWQLNGVKNDILLSDGKYVYVKDDAFNLDLTPAKEKGEPHIVATGLSMLDPYRHHRSLWVVGKDTPYGPTINYAGELLSVHGKDIYSFRAQNGNRNGGMTAKSKYGFGRFEIVDSKQEQPKKKTLPPWLRISLAKAKQVWRVPVDLIVDSMILTGTGSANDGVVFLAGAVNPGTLRGLEMALNGKGQSRLQARAVSNGKLLAEYKLADTPVHDGMAAVDGKVFVPLENGCIICFEKVEAGN